MTLLSPPETSRLLDPQEALDVMLLARKRNGFLAMRDGVRLLALGSSHGHYGFRAADLNAAYNLCTPSQDLRHSRLLYDYAMATGAPIRDVVVFFSVFTPGHDLTRTDERSKGALMKEVFGLDVDYDDPAIAAVSDRVAGIGAGYTASNDEAGFFHDARPWFFPASYGAKRRAEDHLKHHHRGGQEIHLAKLAGRLRQARQRLLVVIPPARADYRSHMPPPRALFTSLYALQDDLRGGVDFDILDLFEDSRFEAADFGDFDHLNPHGEGARTMTRAIGERLAAI